MALFTGKGDTGTTTAFGCNQQRISKSSELPEALGALDELNAFLGFVKMHTGNSLRIAGIVREVQETLFIIQAQTAGADKKIREGTVKNLEDIVNGIEKEIPKLKGFSIAGGTELSALLDVARTLARRAERRIIAVKEMNPVRSGTSNGMNLRELPPETMAYMNRLSSLLFALARLANYEAGVVEENPRY